MCSPDKRRTPTGLQSRAELGLRRCFVAALNFGIYALLLGWLGNILATGGWSVIDALILVAFAIAAPWSVLGFSNALLGLWLLRRHDGAGEAAPFLGAFARAAPLTSRTAVIMTIRNEDAARAVTRLRAIKNDLDSSLASPLFEWFILSDTSDPTIASMEERAFAAWIAAEPGDPHRLHYRRRSDNRGYKAGNIREFCETQGDAFVFMIPLDADSLMDGETILRMISICEAYPRIGILQSLVVGAPSKSVFARLFQFGMRHGMRSYTMGAAWWAGDCGPYWGHNAVVRVAPFRDECVLPLLEGDRHILSHDQIEAVLMRRAGYEVRVLPLECGSYEENPTTLVDFINRDLRWCQGNMQYLRLLDLPGILPMSRFQLIWAVSMFIGSLASTAIVALAPFAALGEPLEGFPARSLENFYLVFLAGHLAPKLAGYLETILEPGGLVRYGGGARFLAGAILETIASFIIGAATSLSVSLFMLQMAFGRSPAWRAQMRDVHALSWRDAGRVFWPHMLFGAGLYIAGVLCAPRLLAWSLPITSGYLIALPFAVLTASPRLGEWFARQHLLSIPEDYCPPAVIAAARNDLSGRSVGFTIAQCNEDA